MNGAAEGYSLTPGSAYEIYGILLFQNQTRYLLLDDRCIPGFLPSGLFHGLRGSVFFDWETCEYELDTDSREVLVFIGCPLLAANYETLRDLIDGKAAAVAKFLEYKEYVAEVQES